MAMINHHTKGSSVLEVVEQTITQTGMKNSIHYYIIVDLPHSLNWKQT